MKKALLLVTMISVCFSTAMAQASTVAFSWGANFVTFAETALGTSSGTASSLQWYVDDFAYGVRAERNTVLEGTEGDDLNVAEVTVDKWVNKFVSIGVGIGTMTPTSNNLFPFSDNTFPVADIRGTVELLASHGDKINASVDFNIAARFSTDADGTYDNVRGTTIHNFNGVAASLAVTLGI